MRVYRPNDSPRYSRRCLSETSHCVYTLTVADKIISTCTNWTRMQLFDGVVAHAVNTVHCHLMIGFCER